MKVFFWITVYFFMVSLLLLFFRCCGYWESKEICIYEKEISVMGASILERIEILNGKSYRLTHSNSMFGSIQRALLYKEYLLNDHKLNSLGLSENQLHSVHNNIKPGLKERWSILKHYHYTCILGIIILGIFIGSLIKCVNM